MNLLQKATEFYILFAKLQQKCNSISECYNSNKVTSKEGNLLTYWYLNCRVVLLECLKFELAEGKRKALEMYICEMKK